MSGELGKAKSSSSLGWVLILVASTVYFLSRDIVEPGFGNNADPGARLFPVGLSALLAAGGIALLARDWRQARSRPKESRMEESDVSGIDRRKSTIKAAALLGFLALYLMLLPWVGFGVATVVFAFASMRFLSASWARSGAISVAIVAFVYVLFGVGFRVPLPTGVLGLPF